MNHFLSDVLARSGDASPRQIMENEILAGLGESPKRLPSKYFYDERGSLLFEDITRLDEYYLTRTEQSIMDDHVGEMVECLGEDCMLIEYGSGSSLKTRTLLAHLKRPAAYVPIDISGEYLHDSAEALSALFPGLPILPVCADYTAEFSLPIDAAEHSRCVVYFPGSTIGNFTPKEARSFLRHIAAVVGSGGGLLVGVDLRKDADTLEAAYDDKDGITAAFNKNILLNINNVLGTAIDVDLFEHRAVFNPDQSRVEMHLVSRVNQCIDVGGVPVAIREREAIVTEYSYKYELDAFAGLAAEAGLEVMRVWMDEAEHFSIQYLEVA